MSDGVSKVLHKVNNCILSVKRVTFHVIIRSYTCDARDVKQLQTILAVRGHMIMIVCAKIMSICENASKNYGKIL